MWQEPRVCELCITDDLLRDRIRSSGGVGSCYYCGANRPSIQISALAAEVEQVLSIHFERLYSWSGEWEQKSKKEPDRQLYLEDEAPHVVSALTGADLRIAYDILRFTRFDDDDILREKQCIDACQWWYEFDEINTKNDLTSYAEQKIILDKIFLEDPSLQSYARALVTELPAGTAFYRGRAVTSALAVREIVRKPETSLAPPPKHLAPAGRLNVAGKPVFYGALEKGTCLSELRPPRWIFCRLS